MAEIFRETLQRTAKYSEKRNKKHKKKGMNKIIDIKNPRHTPWYESLGVTPESESRKELIKGEAKVR